jgi:hypothetical protein
VLAARGALCFCLVALVAACGGTHGTQTVARVGDDEITKEDVARMVDFYKVAVERQGQELPPKGSESYHFLEQRLLGLVVYRAQLEQAASKLGIRLSEQEVKQRVERTQQSSEAGKEEGAAGEAYVENVVRIEFLKEKVAARIGERALQNWIDQALHAIPVHYEEGWAP